MRPLEDLTKEELIALIQRERGQAEHIGAGGVPLMGNAEAIRLRAVLAGAVELAKDAHAHWDADREMKVGKLLLALAGWSPGYDQRADAIQAALTQQEQV